LPKETCVDLDEMVKKAVLNQSNSTNLKITSV